MKNRGKLILLAFLLIYLLGYVGLRQTHYIVHRAGYYTDTEGVKRVGAHYIQTTPKEGEPQASDLLVKMGVVFFYLPFTVPERLYWYATVPKDSVWPYPPPEDAPASP